MNAGINGRMSMNFNFKKISVAAIGITVLLATAAVVFSQQPQGSQPPPPPGFGCGHGPGAPGVPPDGYGPLGPFPRELDLTEAQKNAINEMSDSCRETTAAVHETMHQP